MASGTQTDPSNAPSRFRKEDAPSPQRRIAIPTTVKTARVMRIVDEVICYRHPRGRRASPISRAFTHSWAYKAGQARQRRHMAMV